MSARIQLTAAEQASVDVALETLADAGVEDLASVGGAEHMVGRLRYSLQSILAIIGAGERP